MRNWAALLILLAYALCAERVIAQSVLPADVQIDLLKADIYDLLKAERYNAALEKFDELREVMPTLPAPLVYLEAQASVAAKDYFRAEEKLQEYFNAEGRDEATYKKAFALFRQIKPLREEAEREIDAALLKEFSQKIPGRWGTLIDSCHGWEYVFESVDTETVHFTRFTDEGYFKHEHLLIIEGVTDHKLRAGATINGKYVPSYMAFSWTRDGELLLRFEDDDEDRILSRCE